jgi:hypothetical protein
MRRDNAGKIHYGMLILTTLILALLFCMILEIKIIAYRKDSLLDVVLLANLSACSASAVRFVDSMEIVRDTDMVYDFRQMAEQAIIEIDEKEAFFEFCRLMNENSLLYETDYEIKNFFVYNVCGEKITAAYYENGVWRWEENKTGEVYSPNGVPIRDTAVYASVRTEACGILLKKQIIEMENCVIVKLNEDLQ